MKQLFYWFLAIAGVLGGLVGLIIPGFPTVVVLCLGLFALSKADRGLYRQLKRVSLLKAPMHHVDLYRGQKSMTPRAKFIVTTLLTTTLGLGLWKDSWLGFKLLLILGYVLAVYFVLQTRTIRKATKGR